MTVVKLGFHRGERFRPPDPLSVTHELASAGSILIAAIQGADLGKRLKLPEKLKKKDSKRR